MDKASGSFFQKPRPIFWEWFFFGNTSPLRDLYGNCVPWFNLEIDFESDGINGRVREVIPEEAATLTEMSLINFGRLLTYCYVFGIRDIHKENLIMQNGFLQPVDAEIVFSKLLLPNETLLLPFKEITFEKSGLSLLFASKEYVNTEQALSILKGFADLFEQTLNIQSELDSLLTKHLPRLRHVPIRHIVHDTSKYKNWELKKETYLPEELEQLERGDIPYFFKYLGGDLLFYKTSRSTYKPVELTPDLFPNFKRDGSYPFELINSTRLDSEVMPTGLLYLARELLTQNCIGVNILTTDSQVTLSSDFITFQYKNKKYQVSRPRK